MSEPLYIFDAFTQAYLTAAYWTNDESADAQGQDYSKTHRPKEMHKLLDFDSLCLAVQTCKKFQEDFKELLARAGSAAQNGHDLWLTRNHHGAGFWDRGYPDEIGDALTDAAHKLGESDLYAGDDGKLYFSR